MDTIVSGKTLTVERYDALPAPRTTKPAAASSTGKKINPKGKDPVEEEVVIAPIHKGRTR